HLVTGLTVSSWAQDPDAGKATYMSACAGCHGIDAKGKGPRPPGLRKKPADLTALARKNKGVFPDRAIQERVDGRNMVASHGTREMRVWACRHTAAAASEAQVTKKKVRRLAPTDTVLDLPCDPEAVSASHIQEVVGYLSRIQEK